MVMTGWEWFGLFIFITILMLLFFAAFGGTNITDESVEEYMKRLMNEDKGGNPNFDEPVTATTTSTAQLKRPNNSNSVDVPAPSFNTTNGL